MAYLTVNDDVFYGVSQEADPEDDWSRDSTYEEHDIRSVHEVSKDEYWELVTEFDIDPSRNYFLLYAVYSTGDSFGTDEGRIEFVGLYSDMNVAHENARRIEEHDNRGGESYSVNLVTESGEEFKLHTPWVGYFESLTNVEVQTVCVS